MSQKKPPIGPRIEVIRRPGSQPPAPKPGAAVPPPNATPSSPAPARRPDADAAPPPAPRSAAQGPDAGPRSRPPPSTNPRPGGPGGRPPARGAFSGPPRGPGGRPFPPRRAPLRPPTVEEINALAKKERVPARIAKGELEGKMKSRIWRKLHSEEARRFDQAYTLLEKHPEIDLADAFGVVQSGKTVAEFLAKKARGKIKTEIKEARGALSSEPIDGFLNECKEGQLELAIVLGDRTLVDKLTEIQPVAFVLERAGRVEKLQVVLIGRKEHWEKLSATLERDPKLTRKPVAVQRQPDRRPIADPRVFLPHVGQNIRLELRNGIILTDRLAVVGPYDVLLGEEGAQMFVPLHAMLRWSEPGARLDPPTS